MIDLSLLTIFFSILLEIFVFISPNFIINSCGGSSGRELNFDKFIVLTLENRVTKFSSFCKTFSICYASIFFVKPQKNIDNKVVKVILNLNIFNLLLSFGSNLNRLDIELTFRLNGASYLSFVIFVRMKPHQLLHYF